jgi:hypothetical protein
MQLKAEVAWDNSCLIEVKDKKNFSFRASGKTYYLQVGLFERICVLACMR